MVSLSLSLSLISLSLSSLPLPLLLSLSLPPSLLGWNSFANLLFIDQPAGTGFSYVTNPLGYVTNERTIGTELWTMLQEFYSRYPKYANLDLYIVGESYGERKLHVHIIIL